MKVVTAVSPLQQGELYLLDGGFSTQLGKYKKVYQVFLELAFSCWQGVDDDPLWTARSLVEDQEAVVRVHRDFLAAGARIVLTDSYQVQRECVMLNSARVQVSGPLLKTELGLGEEDTARLLEESARLAWQAVREEGKVPGRVLVAGSLGPYGACLHDGSEYTVS